MTYTYWILHLVIALPVLLLSFDRKVAYSKRWKNLFPAILLMLVPFIIWDSIFTQKGFWGFSDQYTSGIEFLHLPIEEWMFFITVPFATVFIYDCLKYWFRLRFCRLLTDLLNYSLIILCLVVLILEKGGWYTHITAIGLIMVLMINIWLGRRSVLNAAYPAYLVTLIPFLLVNGLLTGTGIEGEVVWYNDLENLSIRLGTIPVEDFFYSMILFFGTLTFYEGFNKRTGMNHVNT